MTYCLYHAYTFSIRTDFLFPRYMLLLTWIAAYLCYSMFQGHISVWGHWYPQGQNHPHCKWELHIWPYCWMGLLTWSFPCPLLSCQGKGSWSCTSNCISSLEFHRRVLGGARDCSAERQTCSHRDVTADREPRIECLGLFSPVSSY